MSDKRKNITRRDALLAGRDLASATMFAALLAQTRLLGGNEAHAQSTKKLTGPINVLAWEGYDDPEIIKPFEDKHGVKVNVKIAPGNSGMLDQVRAKAIQFDVVNPDANWLERFAQSGLIEPLNRADYQASLDKMFKPFRDFAGMKWQGQMYGVPMRWGVNGIVHYTDKLSVAEATDGNCLWDPKLKNRVTMREWYDTMTNLTALYMGLSREPWKMSNEQLDKAIDRLIQFKPNLRSIHTDGGAVKTDLANQDAWVCWAGSSNDVTITLKLAGKAVALTIPKQGALMFTESLVMVKGTQHPETVKAFLTYMTSPEVHAKMAWSKNKKICVCSEGVKNILTAEQYKTLDLDNTEKWVSASLISQAPADADTWKKAWQRFKSA